MGKVSMAVTREAKIREKATPPTLAVLDRWQQLSTEHLGFQTEVVIGDRRTHPTTSGSETNTVMPFRDPVKGPMLLVLLEEPEPFDEVIFTHEVLHIVMALQGFKFLGPRIPNTGNSRPEVLLNSLVNHPPLYALQRAFGIDPQECLDKRARTFIDGWSRDTETGGPSPLLNALRLADNLTSCSDEIAQELRETMRSRHPHAHEWLEIIEDILRRCDLSTPRENLGCARQLIQRLRLERLVSWDPPVARDWVALDLLVGLRDRVKGSRSDATM